MEQGSAAIGGCSTESDGRGPAIRYALPFRSPERSRGITGRPAPCPVGAGAAHLAAAAPKRARRPGALHAGCLEMPAKRLPLRGAATSGGGTMLPDAQPEHIHRITSRFGASAAGKTTPPSIAPSSLTLAEIFAGRANALEGCGAAPVP